ncbi:MAG: hypothetical protein ACI9GW_003287 [Halieaceae bacterium]|jgi:hypothetical protein
MAETEKKLSTSALARALDLPAQQLFATLQDAGWIKRIDSGWALTGKGEFEGGSYQDSPRFGRYIQWPESLRQHALISSVEARQKLTATGVARCFKLHARSVNRAFAEMGLQQHTLLGWELTRRGTRYGGLQEESENSGALYISWPRDIVDDSIIRRELEFLTHFEPESGDGQRFTSRDGHLLDTQLELHVCNWLYLAQLVHAHKRRLPVEEDLRADFYLPQVGVYIECWLEDEPHLRLTDKLAKQEVCGKLQLDYIDVHERDIHRLDEVLGRRLHEKGLRW